MAVNMVKNSIKKTFPAIFLLVFLTTSVSAQFQTNQTDKNSKKLFGTETSYSSKSVQKHYQSIFSLSGEGASVFPAPSFDQDKEQLLSKIREMIPMDGPVDPESYYLGPGDVLEINILSEAPVTLPVSVSPEATLSIPLFGTIEVRGLTLAEAKKEIAEKLGEKYRKAEITATLLSPRIFNVYVGGLVKNPGTFYASPFHRADFAIYQANLGLIDPEKKELKLDQLRKEFINKPETFNYFRDEEQGSGELEMSLRNIHIVRRNGDTLSVDLMRYYATGDLLFNPYLNDGDRLIVPNLDLEKNSVTISGNVSLQGTFEYSATDSIGNIFSIVQGAGKNADLENVDLYRLDEKEESFSHKVINLEKVIAGEAEDFPLLPGDRIVVRAKVTKEKIFNVMVRGEVKRPGMYPVIRDVTKLSDLIKSCGGFTADASLSEAKVVRFSDPLDRTESNPDYLRMVTLRLSDMDPEERQYFNFESTIQRNFLSVDFNALFEEKEESADITLDEGDIIIVPPKSNTVYIYGQVARPGYLTFQKGMDYEYYISKAGGSTIMAEDGDVMIIKAGSRNWIEAGDTEIEPGDMIWIPREKDRDFEYYFTWFSKIVSVLGGVATIIILLRN